MGNRELTVSAMFAGTGELVDAGSSKRKEQVGNCVETFTSKSERRFGEATVTYDGASYPTSSATLQRTKGKITRVCKT